LEESGMKFRKEVLFKYHVDESGDAHSPLATLNPDGTADFKWSEIEKRAASQATEDDVTVACRLFLALRSQTMLEAVKSPTGRKVSDPEMQQIRAAARTLPTGAQRSPPPPQNPSQSARPISGRERDDPYPKVPEDKPAMSGDSFFWGNVVSKPQEKAPEAAADTPNGQAVYHAERPAEARPRPTPEKAPEPPWQTLVEGWLARIAMPLARAYAQAGGDGTHGKSPEDAAHTISLPIGVLRLADYVVRRIEQEYSTRQAAK
jgi:hypothetical protein